MRSGLVAHAAGPNMTMHPRRAFAMLFMPEDATFNGKKSALPDEVFAKLKTGDVLADDEHLPLVFSYRNGTTLSNVSYSKTCNYLGTFKQSEYL
ncbi:hypothetical protein F4167_12800 [Candidatus Poribacteria bacterium]|nr:hypothetical protein [Candidatus Poribacteria bacterium]